MEAALPPLARDDTVLVGKSKLLAKVVKAVRDGDQTVLVRWESTKKEQEVAIDNVEKLDFDAKPKRQTRGKRSEAGGADAATPARRSRKRRKKEVHTNDDTDDEAAAEAKRAKGVERVRKHRAKRKAERQAGRERCNNFRDEWVHESKRPRQESSLPSVAEIRAEYQREQEAAQALEAAQSATIDAIERHVKALQSDVPWDRQVAADELGTLAAKSTTRSAIAKAGGIEPLVALARSATADGQTTSGAAAAARALRNLAYGNEVAIAEAGGIPPLVAIVANGTARGPQLLGTARGPWSAAGALHALASQTANRAAIADAGGIKALVALATDRRSNYHEQYSALEALLRLACDNIPNRTAIATALVALVANGYDIEQEDSDSEEEEEPSTASLAALVLEKFATNAANKRAITEAGGIAPLVALLKETSVDGRAWAAGALGALACRDAANQVAIVAAGGLEALTWLRDHGSDDLDVELALGNFSVTECVSQLQSEIVSLQRRLDRYEGTGNIDMTQDDDDDDVQHRDTGLRDLRDRKTEERVVRIKRENQALEDRLLCTICMEADAPRTILFGPCNHFLACASCAAALHECPNCRVPITARTSIANTS